MDCPGISLSAHLVWASRMANFKRSNINVTPQGRHVLSSGSRYSRYAPSKMAVGGIKPMNAKGLRKGGKASHSSLKQRQIFLHMPVIDRK